MKKEKIIVVMPAYCAEKTLEKTYQDIPKNIVDEVIVVDDSSHDKTVKVARKIGLKTFVHQKNLGYGANQKTCYQQALALGADVVVMIHPDYQYDATLTEEMVRPILQKRYNVMLGSRIRTRQEALAGGMPVWKYFSNRFLTMVENLVLGLNLSEYHTGFRAFSRQALETIPFEVNSNDFVFDQEIMVQTVYFGFKIGEIPVPVRYFKEASSINLWRSVVYGLSTLKILLAYLLHQSKIKRSRLFQEKPKFKSVI